MHIVSVSNAHATAYRAGDELVEKILAARRGSDSPDFIAVFGVADVIQAEMRDRLQADFPKTSLHSSSSVDGVLATDWSADSDRPTCAAFVIFDAEGNYGTASAELDGQAETIAAQTARLALANAGRPGEAPELVLLSCSQGHEEDVLAGLREVVGLGTQIFGTSSAGANSEGACALFSSTGCHRNGIVISMLFPSHPVTISQDCGFVATPSNGHVTKAQKRILATIDEEPAASVYARWSGFALTMDPGGQFKPATVDPGRSMPFGRVVGHEAGVPQLQLIQPYEIFADGSIALMCEIEEGDRLWCMAGGHEEAMSRLGPLVDLATAGEDTPPRGGLIVMCASHDLRNLEKLQDLKRQLTTCLDDLPSLTLFSYGGQWMRDNGNFVHANQTMLCAMFR